MCAGSEHIMPPGRVDSEKSDMPGRRMAMLAHANKCSTAPQAYGKEPWLFEAFAAAVAQNHSIAGVLRQLGCTFSGSYYR
jgi:hypothetical protein